MLVITPKETCPIQVLRGTLRDPMARNNLLRNNVAGNNVAENNVAGNNDAICR